MLNSNGKTVNDVIAIVNYAIGKMRRGWNLTETEVEDLQQDGYMAAIRANQSYDPRRAAWSTWIMKRVNGQLRTSIERLRNLGISGASGAAKAQIQDTQAPQELDRDDEDPGADSPDELIASDTATDESADTSSQIDTLLGCIGERSRRVLCLYYGLDGSSPSLSTMQLAERLGFSKKHAFSLLQKAQQEARACLGKAA